MSEKPLGLTTDSHWLNRTRVTAYARILIGLYVLSYILWVAASTDGMTPAGYPIGNDFLAFWSASYTGLHGNPADAYDMAKLLEAEKVAIPAMSRYYPWFYPPTFYLAILPLAFLPYFVSCGVFILGTLAAYLAALVQAADCRKNALLIAAFPGVFVNLVYGQNAFLTAALAGAAAANLDRRPALAGVLIGLLCIKPHLAILFPLVLFVSCRWRPMLWAFLTVVTMAAASYWALGADVFIAFLRSPQAARTALETGVVPWANIPTVFAFMRMLGFAVAPSYIAHFAVAAAAAVAVAMVWRKGASYHLRASALFVGTFLVSPYSLDYDLAWLAFPIVWMTLEAVKTGWQRREREVLLAVWLLPVLISMCSRFLSVQIGPFVIIVFFIAVLRRAFLVSPSAITFRSAQA
jgi:hypothetical protein